MMMLSCNGEPLAFDATLSRIVCSTYVDLLKRFRGLSEADLWTD